MSGSPTNSSKRLEPVTAASDANAETGLLEPALRSVRRPLFFAAVALTTALGVRTMFDILVPNGLTAIEGMILVLFAITFGFTTLSFWSAAAGFLIRIAGLDPVTLRRRRATAPDDAISTRTAIVMPICEEDPTRVFAGLEATWRSLAETGELAHFDFYVLSDTTGPETAAAEESSLAALRARLDAGNRVFYRRRAERVGRKAGNIADFCERWGRHYDYMIVLDADSVMTGSTVLALVRRMQATPGAGIIQSPPVPVRQETLFGRLVQFASQLYGPMLTTGLSFWQLSETNYWGHNAIIRVAPFMKHCGLPLLPGKAPLGGEILSHDFVEAALMRRGGWDVHLLDDLDGSYEEMPSNVIDFAKRDQRWAQGNLQHLRLFTQRGLHPLSRLNFVLGALAYGSSLAWLLLLVLGSTDALRRALVPHQFFGSNFQLFPDWPIVETDKIYFLLGVTVGLLLLPKAFGLLIALFDRGRRIAFGGGIRLVASAALEFVFSILLAPLMMLAHACFVLATLAGHTVKWGAQARDGRNLGIWEAIRFGILPTLLGLAWGGATYIITPDFFWWMTPVIGGLLLSVPLVHLSSLASLGRGLRRLGLLLAPSENAPDLPLQLLERGALRLVADSGPDSPSAIIPEPPPEIISEMPAQPYVPWSLRAAIRRLSWQAHPSTRARAPAHPPASAGPSRRPANTARRVEATTR